MRSWIRLVPIAIVFGAFLVLAVPAAAAPPAQEGGIHIVGPGETLGHIAQQYGVTITALADANGIRNPNFIYAGQHLTIPGSGSFYSAGDTVHVVRPGENLSTIAASYGTTTMALANANGISNPNHIYVGQRLAIIVATGEQSPMPTQAPAPAEEPVAAPPPAPAPAPEPVPQALSSGLRWIDIDLSTQTLTAYDGNIPVFQRLVSTGLAFPTPVGTYTILYKVRSQRMTGPGYDLPNVPWVMYFTDRGHAIHGAYWHNNFGQPMSHGCVNMRIEDAQWLYEFAPNGTQVVVHD